MKGNTMVDWNEIIGDRKNILKWIPISSLKTQLSGDQIVAQVTRSSKERDLFKDFVPRFGIVGNNQKLSQNQLICQMLEFYIVIVLFKIQSSICGSKLQKCKYLIGLGDRYDIWDIRLWPENARSGKIFDYLVIFWKASFSWIRISNTTNNDLLFLVLQPKAYRLL